ncbi:hypothetical protein BRM92_09460, partial [Xanthomonas oryzae pv. oryzae]
MGKGRGRHAPDRARIVATMVACRGRLRQRGGRRDGSGNAVLQCPGATAWRLCVHSRSPVSCPDRHHAPHDQAAQGGHHHLHRHVAAGGRARRGQSGPGL